MPVATEDVGDPLLRRSQNSSTSADEAVTALGNEINARLAQEGADYRVGVAEWLAGSGDAVGRTVFFSNVGNKQLGHHFVPGDPRRGGRTDITYRVGQFFPATSLSLATSTAAIDRAMSTWNGQSCSTIPITKTPDFPAQLFGAALGGPPPDSDIGHFGWLPGTILPPPILGVTITFIFIDPSQLPAIVPTDIDGNRKLDTAFREIYYSDAFSWADDGVTNIDLETVALHEAGHGLSQAHFGKLFRTDSNGRFHFAARAVMNAGYTGPQRTPLGTDDGGHCSIWGSWPNN